MYDTDEDGRSHPRYERYHHQECRTHGFRYQMNVFQCPMTITYNKTGGGFFTRAKLHYTAANAFAPDPPLFTVRYTRKSLLPPSRRRPPPS